MGFLDEGLTTRNRWEKGDLVTIAQGMIEGHILMIDRRKNIGGRQLVAYAGPSRLYGAWRGDDGEIVLCELFAQAGKKLDGDAHGDCSVLA